MPPRKTVTRRAAEPEAATPEVPLEELAAKAAAEGLQLEDATGDADGNDAPEPETEVDVDVLRYDPNRLGSPEPYVHKRWPHAARGRIANRLFDAADVLGYPHDVVRSTSDGFKYPENLDRYLFPSEYAG